MINIALYEYHELSDESKKVNNKNRAIIQCCWVLNDINRFLYHSNGVESNVENPNFKEKTTGWMHLGAIIKL
jgi:hypothetical protein